MTAVALESRVKTRWVDTNYSFGLTSQLIIDVQYKSDSKPPIDDKYINLRAIGIAIEAQLCVGCPSKDVCPRADSLSVNHNNLTPSDYSIGQIGELSVKPK